MATAARLLKEAGSQQLEFLRPFQPTPRRPEDEFESAYAKLEDLQIDASYGAFPRDDPTFLYKLFSLLGDESRRDLICWDPEGRVVVVKKIRVLLADGHLLAHDISPEDDAFVRHLRQHGFRQLEKTQARRRAATADFEMALLRGAGSRRRRGGATRRCRGRPNSTAFDEREEDVRGADRGAAAGARRG